MSLHLYRRKEIWHYRGTVAGCQLRGSTRATDREIAARIASEIENRHWKRHLDGPSQTLTFPQAVTLYLKSHPLAGRQMAYVGKLEDYWKDAEIKTMTAGAIRQSAINLYPDCSGATWNRQAVTPTQAIINHCAELELCAPIRVKRFTFEKKIRQPISLNWIDAFVSVAEPSLGALALFLFSTGCRISEARRVQWDDINFQQRTILIRKTKNKRQRLPYMPARLLIALANLPRDRSPFGRPESTLRKAWDATIAQMPGAERLTFHCCRHGFATALLHDGVDVVTIAKLGGWDDPHQILKNYGHAMDDPKLTERLFSAWRAQTNRKISTPRAQAPT